MNRRDFIKSGSLASMAFMMPDFLKPFQRLAPQGYRNLVIIQLSGANDGLNTVVPYANDIYYNARKTIAIPPTDILKLNEQAACMLPWVALKNFMRKGY
jgi:uncharacterized protein (DUF1501 family)